MSEKKLLDLAKSARDEMGDLALSGPLSSFRTRFLNQSYLGYAAH